jgi:hypothetical protein
VTAGGSVVEAGGASDVLLSAGARRGIAVHCFPLILVRKAPAGSPDMANRTLAAVFFSEDKRRLARYKEDSW